MANIKLGLKKKNGVFYVVFNLYHKRDKRQVFTGYTVENKKDLIISDPKTGDGILKKNPKIKNIARANNEIKNALENFRAKLATIEKNKDIAALEISDLKNQVFNNSNNYLTTALNDKFKRLENAGKFTTSKNYFRTLNYWRKYLDKENILFDEITPQLLKNAEIDYLARGRSLNGFWGICKDTKAVFNEYIKGGLLDPAIYPFNHYKAKFEKTKKRAISKDLLNKIFSAPVKGSQKNAVDIFKVSFFLAGINITDLALLRVNSIIDGKIHYKRSKTGDLFKWDIAPQIAPIINAWKKGKKPNDYLAPILSQENGKDILKTISLATGAINWNLNKVAGSVGINENITTYTARHSWASIARDNGVKIHIISKALGHESIKTTEIYLNELNYTDVNQANELISGLF